MPSIFGATSGGGGLKDFSGSVWDTDALWKHRFSGKWTDNKGRDSIDKCIEREQILYMRATTSTGKVFGPYNIMPKSTGEDFIEFEAHSSAGECITTTWPG